MTTPSQARNAIKRSIKELIDPGLSKADKNKVWDYFESNCAFCGAKLDRGGREGHMDHLVPEAQGGLNGLVNRVLACGSCNGDEKLDANWQNFLERKVTDSGLQKQRKNLIDKWVSKHGGQQTLGTEMRGRIESDFEKVNNIYTDVVQEIRDSRLND